jgi:hypothetical protein
MKPRAGIVIAGMLLVTLAAHGLNPPSASDGPIKLLACVVTTAGILEAEVDSSVDDTMSCDIRCHYELVGRMFSHTLTVTIPARFQGRVGHFDTNNATPGSYSGEIGRCQKSGR